MQTASFRRALEEAEVLSSYSNEDNLKTCVFTKGFARAQPRKKGERSGHDNSAATRRKKLQGKKVCSKRDGGNRVLEQSAVEELLSVDKNVDWKSGHHYKPITNSTGVAAVPTNLCYGRNITKKRRKSMGRKSMGRTDLVCLSSVQLRQQNIKKKDRPSVEGVEDTPSQKSEKSSSRCKISDERVMEHTVLSCPHKEYGEVQLPSSMEEILEAEKEAQKELEMIESMLSLVQGDDDGSSQGKEQKDRMLERELLEEKENMEDMVRMEKVVLEEEVFVGKVDQSKGEGKNVMEKGLMDDLLGEMKELDGKLII